MDGALPPDNDFQMGQQLLWEMGQQINGLFVEKVGSGGSRVREEASQTNTVTVDEGNRAPHCWLLFVSHKVE